MKVLYNDTLYSHELNSASSGIQTQNIVIQSLEP